MKNYKTVQSFRSFWFPIYFIFLKYLDCQKKEMTDYFEELNCQPIEAENTGAHQLLLMVRYLQQSGYDEFMNMGEDKLPPAASKELVKNLKRRLVKEEDEKCAICLLPNENLNGEIFVSLPCGHEFHDTCILPWLEKVRMRFVVVIGKIRFLLIYLLDQLLPIVPSRDVDRRWRVWATEEA